MERDEAFERQKAHFHRVLMDLLAELAAWEQTVWLEEDPAKRQHIRRPDGELNAYGRALYCTEDLKGYEAKLRELQGIQDAVMRDYPLKRVPHSLLLPLVFDRVQHVRVHQSVYHSSKAHSRSFILERLDDAIRSVSYSYNRHREQSDDDKTRAIGDELTYHKNVREWIRNHPEDQYRLRIREKRYRLYVYRLDGSSFDTETRLHGTLLVGPKVIVEPIDRAKQPRRERSDKIKLKPLWHYGVSHVYPESLWQEAKKQ